MNELENEINSLKSERVFLSTKLAMAMEGYWNNVPTSKEDMDGIRIEIAAIDEKLTPLVLRFEGQFHHYYVRFSSNMPDTLGNTKSRYSYHNVYRSKIDCNINWNIQQRIDLSLIPNAIELVSDIAGRLISSYSNLTFEVIIKRD